MTQGEKHETELCHRRRQVAELALQGWSQSAIADHLGVSQPTICADVKAIRKEWRESSIRDFDELRLIELQKLDFLEREAWAGWFRSQKPAQAAVVTGDGSGNLTKKSMKHQIGDPRYLAVVNHCISQRRAILGLDMLTASPQEARADANLSLDARRQQVLTLFAAISQRAGIGADPTKPNGDEPGNVRAGDEPGTLADGSSPEVP